MLVYSVNSRDVRHIMDRQVLSSVRATENNSKYAAALLANGKQI